MGKIPKVTEPPKEKPIASNMESIGDCAFLNYALTHNLPGATERHITVSRNMAMYIHDKPNFQELKEMYVTVQDKPATDLDGWLKGIEKGKATPICCGELLEYQKKNKISSKCKGCKKLTEWKKQKEQERITALEAKGKIAEDSGNLKEAVLTKLALRKMREATEIIVKDIKDKHKIYSIRDDEQSEMWIYKEGIYVPEGETYIQEHCRSILGEAFSTQFSNEVITKIRTDTYIKEKDFFDMPALEEIPAKNGILNLVTKELSEFTPDKIFFSKLPIEYDPDAKCPFVLKHFENVLECKEDLNAMQELFGSLLWKENFAEKAFMLAGDSQDRDGRNGKGKTEELMKRFIGPENCIGIPVQNFDDDPYALSELLNKMANIAGDLSSTALRFSGNFKMSTGRDFLSARRKFKPLVHFVNYAKHIFACNQLPVTYDNTQAFWERWILFKFIYMFIDKKKYDALSEEEKKYYRIKDPNIIQKITTDEELSGLLNWAMEGLDRLRKNEGEFTKTKSADDLRKYWTRKSCSIKAFLNECCELDYNEKISKKDFKKIYVSYCNEHKLKPDKDKVINSLLETFGASEDRMYIEEGEKTRQIYAWLGIKINEEKEKIETEKMGKEAK